MSDVTRSYDATSDVAVREVARRRRSQPIGWWGMAMLIATEATLFGTLISTYFYLRFQATAWPPPGIDPPSIPLPLSLTGALVATSVPVLLAVRAARDGRGRRAAALVMLGVAVQCGYLATQIVLYLDDLHRFSPRDTAYGSIYFTLLMAHHLHVLVAILLGSWIALRLARGLTVYRLNGLRAIAIYVYFVNAAAVFVVLTQLSPSL
ncbi:MAG: heme-copper oxidase subunit III [Thermoleophilaceae bacterium]